MIDAPMAMTKLELLIKAREKIRQGWTQNVSARNSDNYPVNVDALEAVAWCALGAIWAVRGTYETQDDAERELCKTIDREYAYSIAEWNDKPGRTKEEVLDLYDRTINRVRKE